MRKIGCFRTLVAFCAVVTLSYAFVGASTAMSDGPSGPRRQTSSDLDEKRYVAAGDRAYTIGTTDGNFPAMGWHIRGEMGGVWVHPVKTLDGYWFGVRNGWLPPASKFVTGPGYVEMHFPKERGMKVTRTEFSPDGSPVTLIKLEFAHAGQGRPRVDFKMDVRSELMASYPWGWTTPSARDFNQPDVGSYDSSTGTLWFKETGKPWFATVGASVRPSSGETGSNYWGPLSEAEQAAHMEMGKGTGGRLNWRLRMNQGGRLTMWIATAGSRTSRADAEAQMRSALANADALFNEKIARRRDLLARTDIELPDEVLEAAFDWGKLNMEDLRRTVTDAEIRDVDEGRQYPPPIATVPELTGIGAGYPDYPWYFGTDGAYTAFPLVSSGQWETAKEHLRSIRDVSRIVNGSTGKVVHEVMTEGSVYFGANDDPGNTNETSQFTTAVHLIWQWSGDDSFRDGMYDFMVDGMRYVMTTLDKDGDNWPEGNGMVERPGMGSEKLDVTVYTWMALRALQDMALAKGDAATATWAEGEATAMEASFEDAWWMPEENLYADSLCNPGDEGDEGTNVCPTPTGRLQQKHWINATPMEGLLAIEPHAHAALDRLESPEFTGECGLFHTGRGGGPTEAGELKCWTLPNSVMAVAEANYGRTAGDEALHYMHAIAEQIDLEQPGALPEITPSPEYDPFVDFRERAMFMQAWSSYGIQWPVVYHFLGVRPDVPHGRLSVVPDVPDGWPGLSVSDLRVDDGTMAAAATVEGNRYETTTATPPGLELTIGHVLPSDATVESVTLDGAPVPYEVRDTTRGREVLVETTSDVSHRLVVTTGS
ncbi:MAG: glycogen debranching protein [Actinomycetota bacterium]